MARRINKGSRGNKFNHYSGNASSRNSNKGTGARNGKNKKPMSTGKLKSESVVNHYGTKSKNANSGFAPISENAPRGPLAVQNQCVGILREVGFDGVVFPDPGYPTSQYGQIFIHHNHLNGAPYDMKVVCEITNPNASGTRYEGKIIEVLGDPGRNDIAILSILRQYGLEQVFPEKVLEEVAPLPNMLSEEDVREAIAGGRKDLRALRTITIDGEEAKDLDDAISIERRDSGYHVWVHIADVSSYVKSGTELDKEALKRATSVYLVDRVIPMLPPKLSNGLCSLNPKVPRLTLTVDLLIDENGHVETGNIYESVIQSDARTSYNEVYGVLFEQKYLDEYRDFLPMFEALRDIKKLLSENRTKRGAIEFDFPETHVELNADGEPTDIYAYPINYAHGIIEELMILANEFVAYTFNHMEMPFVYRVHEEPQEEKIHDFMHVARLFGVHTTPYEKISSTYISSIMRRIADEPFAPALNQILLRSMAKAKYSAENLGHYGLSSDYYCHFTSPIRRYPDLYIHRIIKSYLHQEHKTSYFRNHVDEVALHSSDMERNSIEAERASVDQKVSEYMVKHIGEEYVGLISSIFNAGIFVRLENTVEGFVPFRTMDDYYEFDEAKMEARAKRLPKVYRIGMKVRVKVVAADTLMRRIDFSIVLNEDEMRNAKKRARIRKKQ
ncbi:MAG TPA: ribonuclease R [Bacillota bacterium]|nr:ribonuclease R [Bacillota bacterium]